MRETRVAQRYAHAIFLVAKSRDNIDIIASELFQLRSFIENDKRFISFPRGSSSIDRSKNRSDKIAFCFPAVAAAALVFISTD